MNTKKLLIPLFLLFQVFCLSAADIYVDNEIGKDSNDGLSPETPIISLGKAVKLAKAGDTIHLAKTEKLYRQCFNLSRHPGGTVENPLTIDGHEATLSGADPCAISEWKQWKGNIYRNDTKCSKIFLMVDDKMILESKTFNALKPGEFCFMPTYYNRLYFYIPPKKKITDFNIEVGQPDGKTVKLDPAKWQRSHSKIGGVRRYNGLKRPTWIKINGESATLITMPERLEPGQWCAEQKVMYFNPPEGKAITDLKIEAVIRGNGVTLSGSTKHVVVKNLNVQHVFNDGYNIHNSVTHATFLNCDARQCGDEGFSAHDNGETILDGAVYEQCDNGIANVNRTGSSVTRNVIIRDSRSVGFLIQKGKSASHTLENAIFIDNPTQISAAQTKLDNILIVRTPKYRTDQALNGGDLDVTNLTAVGNSRFLRTGGKTKVSLTNCLITSGKPAIHVRANEFDQFLNLKSIGIKKGLIVEWGAKYPWKTRLLEELSGVSIVDVSAFTNDLLKGKIPAQMPKYGCSKELIAKYAEFIAGK